MDRLDSSRKGSHAVKGNLLPKRVEKQPKNNGQQILVEAKDIYSTKSKLNSTNHHERFAFRQSNELKIKTSAPTTTSKDENGKFPTGNSLFVRRLSQSGVSPGSQEFQSVLRAFISPKESEVVKPKSQISKPRSRKISYNDLGKASRMTKRLEDMSLSPRPKRSLDMINAPTISSINRAVEHRKIQNNDKATQSRRSFPYSNIKVAWHESQSLVEGSKVERRRHVSLPAPPPGFYLEKRQETLLESFKEDKPSRKDSGISSRANRKVSTVLSPILHDMDSSCASGSSTDPVLSDEDQTITGRRKVLFFPGTGNSASFPDSIPEPESIEFPPRAISTTLSSELSKFKQISTANGHDLHPNLLLGIKNKQVGSNGELLADVNINDGEHQAALRARKNFQRIGKAAVAARRFLGIHSRGTAGAPKQQPERAISPLAKDNNPFEEMVEEMKSSYQSMSLGATVEEGNYNETKRTEMND